MDKDVVDTRLTPKIGILPQPETELEAKIAEKFGWDDYIFQFPPIIEQHYKTVEALSEDFKWIVPTQIVRGKPIHPIIYDKRKLPPNLSPQTLETKLNWRYKKLNLPKEFAREFPYLDRIIRDQIMTSIVNNHVALHLEDRLTSMNAIMFQLIKMVVSLVQLIWQIPHSKKYLKEHPDQLQLVDSAVKVSQLFVGDRIAFPQLFLKSK